MAYDAVALSARLLIHTVGRQQEGIDPPVCKSIHDDVARRPVARGRLDVRIVGRAAWLLSHMQPRLALVHRAPCVAATTYDHCLRTTSRADARVGNHIVGRDGGLGLLPRGKCRGGTSN